MNYDIRFDYVTSGVTSSQYTNCHEFLKDLSNYSLIFYVPYKKLNVPLKDVLMLIDKLNEINKTIDIDYFGIENRKHSSCSFEKEHVFAFKSRTGKERQSIESIILMNILRWTFQTYAYETAGFFIEYVKKGIDPLQALLMAQMLYKYIGSNAHNIIVSRILSIPIFYTYNAFIEKKGKDENLTFQTTFKSDLNCNLYYEGPLFEKAKTMLLENKIEEFIKLMNKQNLWIEK